MTSLRILPMGLLVLGLAACRLPTGTSADPSIEMVVEAVQGEGFMPVTIRNTGSTSLIHSGLCGAFVLQRRDGDDWELADNESPMCPLVYTRHELLPGEEVTGGIYVSDKVLRGKSSEYRVWLWSALRDENDNPIPDDTRASEPFRIE